MAMETVISNSNSVVKCLLGKCTVATVCSVSLCHLVCVDMNIVNVLLFIIKKMLSCSTSRPISFFEVAPFFNSFFFFFFKIERTPV